ncbi:hypothetical protein L1987_32541 [Smallanthus sonchifolius]|uniref:Uncharacterized protein n=1 Tax=Smallanthus sonchifolius TaxID=185202 RepID=A0ACB9HQ87_9ASTR|nr:hypothetical protein L1987_32541 [Smallanthus sonchifolius]
MKRVCVTGARGDEKKNGHLKKLENAEERLHILKADLFDFEGFCAAIAGCSGVIHVASPVPDRLVANSQAELLDPAILGTQNVLNACLKAKVEKVVVVSSVTAVLENPEWPSDMEMDESCWTNIEYAKSTQKWYEVSKTMAEIEALNFAKLHDMTVITICPSIIIGPMLQSTVNVTSLLLLSYMKGCGGRSQIGREGPDPVKLSLIDKASEDTIKKEEDEQEGRFGGDTMDNINRLYTDVRDLSEAILLLYENPESNGRYICSAYSFRTKEFVTKMESLFPGYNYPKIFIEKSGYAPLNLRKLLELGWNYRPLEETIVDTIKNYEEAGLLEKGKPFPSVIRF